MYIPHDGFMAMAITVHSCQLWILRSQLVQFFPFLCHGLDVFLNASFVGSTMVDPIKLGVPQNIQLNLQFLQLLHCELIAITGVGGIRKQPLVQCC